MRELFERALSSRGAETKLRDADGKGVETKDDVAGTTWAITTGDGWGRSFAVLATWRKGDVEIVIVK